MPQIVAAPSVPQLGITDKGQSALTVPEIRDKPVPPNFRLPVLESYDGSSDPTECGTTVSNWRPLFISTSSRGSWSRTSSPTPDLSPRQPRSLASPREGTLAQFVNRMDHPDRRSERDHLVRPLDPVERQIDVIVGRPAAGGDSTSARKAYTKAAVEKRPRRRPDLEISFQPEGEEYPDHDDALVVTVHIANARVKRITIDTGSVTDILYFKAFQ
ncbi:hypothetical protein B296_00042200 [Ensete ventricosum]|uniref:Uncharacterized protein n=1 Tax=Ensete ventricosum TaxID=4639 RepID=A0A426YSX8_ENSVE|nr:hypothetical protein B296_00042200 [Ensete ventricosum]